MTRSNAPALAALLAIVLASAACDRGTPPPTSWPVIPVDARTSTPARFALVHESTGMRMPTERGSSTELIVAVWDSGDIVWRNDAVGRASPYSSGRIERAVVEALERELCATLVPVLGSDYHVPDSNQECIVATCQGSVITLESCHTIFERNPGVVATEHGIRALEGKTRDEVFASDPPSAEFLTFRAAWASASDRLRGLIPASGEPFDAARLHWASRN